MQARLLASASAINIFKTSEKSHAAAPFKTRPKTINDYVEKLKSESGPPPHNRLSKPSP
jgi:hypothetical protein